MFESEFADQFLHSSLAHQAMPSSQILPQLWIGDEFAAGAPEVLPFGHVLNVTIEVPQSSVLAEGVQFERFSIFDYGGDKQQQAMFEIFGRACPIIDEGVASGRGVLVHCVEGKQRSCAVVAAYLIHSMGHTVSQAKDFIVQKRPVAFNSRSHVNFAPALERWEQTVRSSRSAPATERKENWLAGASASGSKATKAQAKTKNRVTAPPNNAARKH